MQEMHSNNKFTSSPQGALGDRNSKATQTSEEQALKDQVSLDLQSKLGEFNDPKKGIKAMAMLMGIHEKTLKRLIDKENRPGYQTVFKIYRVLFHSQNDTELLKIVPKPVKDFLLKAHPRGMNDTVRYNINVEAEIKRDPVFCEIYFLAGAGGVTKEFISYHYGRYGERVMEKMIEQEVLAYINKNTLITGTNQASLTVETIQHAGLHLVERFYKPENSDEMGENYISFYYMGLTEEAFNEWLKIDKEAFQKKVEIAEKEENWGDKKAFTFGVIDTLKEAKKDLKH